MSEFKNVSDKAVSFWNFNLNPVFTGVFQKESKLENDDPVLVFVELETGVIYNLNPSKAIVDGLNAVVIPEDKEKKQKAVTLKETSYIIRVSFIGKVKLKKGGKTFNQFSIQYKEI